MSNYDFLDYVTDDLLSKLRDVTCKIMFGGFGLYQGPVFFAIIADDVLYFKVDDTNRAKYEAAGSKPFSYTTKSGKEVVMTYWQVPAQIMENKTKAAEWAMESVRINEKIHQAKQDKDASK